MTLHFFSVVGPIGNILLLPDTVYVQDEINISQSTCLEYTDNKTANILTTANAYADLAMIKAVESILPTLPLPKPSVGYGALEIVVSKNDVKTFITLRDQDYIDAQDVIALTNANAYTLEKVSQAKLDMSAYTNSGDANTLILAKNYTDLEIIKVRTYIDEHKWLSADIIDLQATIEKSMSNITFKGAVVGTISNNVITTKLAPIPTPIDSLDPTNKSYVDAIAVDLTNQIHAVENKGFTIEQFAYYLSLLNSGTVPQ